MLSNVGFILITCVDVLGTVIIALSIFNPKLEHFSTCFKAGLVFLMLGLLSQAMRNIMYITTGHSPTDSDLPLWAFKDIGVTFVAVSWLWNKIKG